MEPFLNRLNHFAPGSGITTGQDRSWELALPLHRLLWAQLARRRATIALSARHLGGSMMNLLADWVRRIVSFCPCSAESLAGVGSVFKAPLPRGMTLCLVVPFTRLVHVWSAFGTLADLRRSCQLVRHRPRAMTPCEAPGHRRSSF